MSSEHAAVALIIVGAVLQIIGIGLGVWEVRAMRRATQGFLKRARRAYGAGHLVVRGPEVYGAGGVSGPQLVPTIDDRVRALESSMETVRS